MKITFGLDFDSGAWPGPLGERTAVFGEAWLGPLGMITLLETQLGLTGPTWGESERAASVVAGLRELDGYFAQSAQIDPMGTARRLVADRDALWLCGWRGQAVSQRLQELLDATQSVLPGQPDRLESILNHLGTNPQTQLQVEVVQLVELAADLPQPWPTLFSDLARRGVRIEPYAAQQVSSSGDLGAARTAPFLPNADASLQLVRPYGPLAAAEHMAAWLATHASLSSVVVIGADAALDAQLAAFGLPTLGAELSNRDAGLLHVLPLVLALVWEPIDPNLIYELLMLAESPIPKSVSWPLARALERWPAVGSPDWNDALAQWQTELSDAEKKRFAYVPQLLAPHAKPDGLCQATEVRARVEHVSAWLRGKLANDRLRTAASQALHQCEEFLRLLELSQEGELTEPNLRRLVASTTPGGTRACTAQAGLTHLAKPGALVGSASTVIWWNFNRIAPQFTRLRLTAAERSALAQLNIQTPSSSVEVRAQALRWRRPLHFAQKALVLVAPRRSEAGEEQAIHPLWDEIVARVPSPQRKSLLAKLERERPWGSHEVSLTPLPTLALPSPVREWRVAKGTVKQREQESPTSLGALLSCSLRWSLQYGGGLRASGASKLSATPQVLGLLAHELIGKVLANNPTDATAAALEVERLFDQLGPQLVAPLFAAGAEGTRSQTRLAMSRAVARLVSWLAETNRQVVGVELTREMPFDKRTLAGRIDLLVGPEPVVIDLKWGSGKRQREDLKAGTALQLVIYAQTVCEKKKALPLVAYFSIGSGALLSTSELGTSSAVDGPTSEQTWDAFLCAHDERSREMKAGSIIATGVDDGMTPVVAKAGIVEGKLQLTPGCDYCDLTTLCGKAFGAST